MNKTTFSTFLLIATTFIWGFAFLAVQDSFAHGWHPFTIIFTRAFLGGLVCLPFCFRKKWWKNKQLWRDAILCGVTYFLGFAFQSYGQLYSSIANAAFLTTLNVIFVPLILWAFLRKKPVNKVFVAVLFSLTGTAILSFQGSISFNRSDLYLVLCALAFALQIIFAKKAAHHHQPFATTAIQLFTMSLLGGIGMLVTKQMAFPTQGWGGMLYVGILATGLVGIFQMVAQRYVSESTTSIIFSFEAAVAAFAAVAFAYQVFSWRILVGGLCMIVAVLIVEVEWKKIKTVPKQIEP